MKYYQGLWRVQEISSGDKTSRKEWPENKFPPKAIATQNNPPQEGGSIVLTNRLRNIINARSPDIRDISPDKASKLIESLSSPGECVVVSLSGDLKTDRIEGMTLPLYYTHRSKVWTNDQFIFSRIPKNNSFLESHQLVQLFWKWATKLGFRNRLICERMSLLMRVYCRILNFKTASIMNTAVTIRIGGRGMSIFSACRK